jgi:7-carboxy-7-deazaguanine synthase
MRSVDELVGSAIASGAGHVVLTGGEPLVQRDVSDLTRAIRRAGLHLTIETAGVIEPDAGLECDLLSVSPKTSSSDPEGPWRERHRRRRSALGPLISLLARFPDHQIKLVIQQRSDIDDVLALLEQLEAALGRGPGAPAEGSGPGSGRGGSRAISPHRVLLMPEGRDVAQVEQRGPMVAALCLEHGFRYTPRLHLDLFGGGRGV